MSLRIADDQTARRIAQTVRGWESLPVPQVRQLNPRAGQPPIHWLCSVETDWPINTQRTLKVLKGPLGSESQIGSETLSNVKNVLGTIPGQSRVWVAPCRVFESGSNDKWYVVGALGAATTVSVARGHLPPVSAENPYPPGVLGSDPQFPMTVQISPSMTYASGVFTPSIVGLYSASISLEFCGSLQSRPDEGEIFWAQATMWIGGPGVTQASTTQEVDVQEHGGSGSNAKTRGRANATSNWIIEFQSVGPTETITFEYLQHPQQAASVTRGHCEIQYLGVGQLQ